MPGTRCQGGGKLIKYKLGDSGVVWIAAYCELTVFERISKGPRLFFTVEGFNLLAAFVFGRVIGVEHRDFPDPSADFVHSG